VAGVIVGILLQLFVLHKYIKLKSSDATIAVADSTLVVDTLSVALSDSTDTTSQKLTSMTINQLFQQEPVIRYKIEPEYPDSLKQARKEGVVVLNVEVLTDGTVGDVVVAEESESGSVGFDEAAIEAVKEYVYEPFVVNGIPIKFRIKQSIRFDVTN